MKEGAGEFDSTILAHVSINLNLRKSGFHQLPMWSKVVLTFGYKVSVSL